MTVRVIRQSEIAKFKRCPRSWWLSYQRSGNGWKPAPSDKPGSGKRDVGTLFHMCAEAYMTDYKWEVALINSEFQLKQALDVDKLPKEWADTYELVRIMFSGYVEWLGKTGGRAGEMLLEAEAEMKVYIGNFHGDDVYVLMHLDTLIHDQVADEVFIGDYKTVDNFADLKTTINIKDQGRIYCLLASIALNRPIRRFRLDMARKVKRTAKAVPPFYERADVRYSEAQLDATWTHMVSVIDSMVVALQKLETSEELHHVAVYPTPHRDCSWDCDFLAICPMMDDGSRWQAMLDDGDFFVARERKDEN